MSSYDDIGALSVRLNLQTNDFNKKISAINKEIKFLERDLKSAGKGVKNFENSFTGVNAKMQTLNKQIALSTTKLAQQKTRFREFSTELTTQRAKLEALKSSHGELSTEYKSQARLVSQLAEKTRSVQSAIRTTEGALREYNAGLKDARQKMRDMGNSTKTFEQKLRALQEEAKVTSTSFNQMANSMSNGSFGRARVEMERLSSSIQDAKRQVSLYASEIQKMETNQTKAGNKIKSLGNDIKSTANKLKEAKRTYGENSEEAQKLANKLMELKTKLAQTRNEHDENASAIRRHRTAMNELNGSASQMQSRMRDLPFNTVASRLDTLGSSMRNIGTTMGITVGVPLAMLGTTAVKTFAGFEESMDKVKAVSNGTEEQMSILTEQARDLGRETQFSATQAADAMGFLAMAGFDVTSTYEAMPHVLNLAKAGLMDLAKTADITSNVMTGFGLQAEDMGHITDTMAYASNNSNTSIEQLGDAMVYLAPISQTLGLSLEDVSSAVMAISDNGIQGARAGAAFSTSLGRLTKPTKQMKEKMKELGLSFKDSSGEIKPLYQIVDDLNSKLKGQTKASKANAIATLFGAEATRHWASLLNVGSEKLEKNAKAMNHVDGEAKKVADTMADNLAGSFKEMQSKIEDFLITMGESMAPTIRDIADKIGALADWFRTLSPETQALTVKMGALAIALPLVLTGVGMVTSGLGGLVRGFQLINGAGGRILGLFTRMGTGTTGTASLMTRALPLLSNPWVLLAGAVVGASTAIYVFKKNADKRFKEVNESARKHITGVGKYFEKDLPMFMDEFKTDMNSIEFFDKGTTNRLNQSMDNLKKVMESGKGNITQIYGNMVEEIGANMDDVPKEMRESVVQGFVDFGENLAREGKITTKQFEEWVDELNKKAKLKIEIDTKAIDDSRKAGFYFDDWTKAMQENVGSGIQASFKDIEQTLGNMNDVFVKTKDMGINEFTSLAEGIATQVASMGGSFENKKAIFSSFVDQMYDTLNPEQLAVLLTSFSDELKLGTEGMTNVNKQFYDSWTSADRQGKEQLMTSFDAYIEKIGGVSFLMGENFNAITAQDGAFWASYIESVSKNGGEIVSKSHNFVTQYAQTLLETGDPQMIAGGLQQLNNFVAHLVTTGAITAGEAKKIVSSINGELDNVSPEVTTAIKADISNFDEEKIAVLVAMGLLDKEEAVAKINADTKDALKRMEELKKEGKLTKEGVEKEKAKIDADNKSALTKLDDVIARVKNIPTSKSVGISVLYTEKGKPATLGGYKATIKGDRSMEANNEGYTQAVQPQFGYSYNTSPYETRDFSFSEAYAPQMIAFNDSASAMRATLDSLDYNSSSLYKPQRKEERSITISNPNDSALLSMMGNMVESVMALAQRTNTIEANLYLDGQKMKSRMEKLESRKSRLAGN